MLVWFWGELLLKLAGLRRSFFKELRDEGTSLQNRDHFSTDKIGKKWLQVKFDLSPTGNEKWMAFDAGCPSLRQSLFEVSTAFQLKKNRRSKESWLHLYAFMLVLLGVACAWYQNRSKMNLFEKSNAYYCAFRWPVCWLERSHWCQLTRQDCWNYLDVLIAPLLETKEMFQRIPSRLNSGLKDDHGLPSLKLN